MRSEERLAQLADALDGAGVEALVLGGHAVRYYGVDRNTVDYDFCTSVASVKELQGRLAQVKLLQGLREGRSWRPDDFARFEIGRLPDGREEWLEFWLHNTYFLSFRRYDNVKSAVCMAEELSDLCHSPT